MIKNDSYNWIKGGEPIYPDAYRHLGEILGEELMAEYADIFPVLCIIFLDINTRYISTGSFNALFSYDEEYAISGLGAAISVLKRTIFNSLAKKAAKLPKEKAVMLSSTFTS